jgi:HEAT repeat protein
MTSKKLSVAVAAIVGVGIMAVVIHRAVTVQPPPPEPPVATPPPSPVATSDPPAPFTAETALDAELTLTARGMMLADLGKLVEKRTGVRFASHKRTATRYVSLEPGTRSLRQVVDSVAADLSLTTEAMLDGKRAIVCFWQTPDAEASAQIMPLATSDDVVERRTGARWLEPVGGREALLQLLKMLADPDARVRAFAAAGVVNGWLLPWTPHEASALRCVAPDGTGAAVVTAIEAATRRETWKHMLQIAGDLREPTALPVLHKQLRDWAARYEAKEPPGALGLPEPLCEAIAVIGGPDAEAILRAEAEQLPGWGAYWGVYYLIKMGADSAAPLLRRRVATYTLTRVIRGYAPLGDALEYSDSPAVARDLLRRIRVPRIRPTDLDAIAGYLARYDLPDARAECRLRFSIAAEPAVRGALGRAMLNVPTVRQTLLVEALQAGPSQQWAALVLAPTDDVRLVPTLATITDSTDTEALLTAVETGADPREVAVQALGRIGGAEAEKTLIDLALSGDAGADALGVLWNHPSSDVRDALTAAVQNPDGNVSTIAAVALGRRRNPDDLDVLLEAARTKRSERVPSRTVQPIWDAVAAIGGERAAKELLIDVATGDSGAARALLYARDTHCLRAAREALTGGDADLREKLIAGFDTKSADEPPLTAFYAVPGTVERLGTVYTRRMMQQATVLGWIADPRGTDALSKLLVDAEATPLALRWTAIRALAQRKRETDPAGTDALLHALENDPDKSVKSQAKRWLLTWGVIPNEKKRGYPAPKVLLPKPPDGFRDPAGEREFMPPDL